MGKITLADVQNFYAKEYLPMKMILTIVGDVSVEQATTLVQTHLGSWKKGMAQPRTIKKPAIIDKKIVQLVKRILHNGPL